MSIICNYFNCYHSLLIIYNQIRTNISLQTHLLRHKPFLSNWHNFSGWPSSSAAGSLSNLCSKLFGNDSEYSQACTEGENSEKSKCIMRVLRLQCTQVSIFLIKILVRSLECSFYNFQVFRYYKKKYACVRCVHVAHIQVVVRARSCTNGISYSRILLVSNYHFVK